MQLNRVINCVKLLNWETALPHPRYVDEWVRRLQARGARSRPSRLPGLTRLELDGHELLIVHRSGRVSIRLDYTTEHSARGRAAQQVFRLLVQAVRDDTQERSGPR